MFSFVVLSLFVRLIAAAPANGGPSIEVGLVSGDSPLSVISTVSNTGNGDVSVMKFAPLLSSNPIKHFRVFDASGAELQFGGISAFFDIARAGGEAWEAISAGQSIDRTINLAESFTFPAAGEYTVAAAGVFQVLEGTYSADAASASEFVEYAKNLTISISEDDVAASATRRSFLQKRLMLGTCTSSQAPIYREDFAGVKRLATRAVERTRARDSKFATWFGTTEAHYFDFVANTFQKIEDASTVSTTSNIIANCNDPTNHCSGGIIAYAVHPVGIEGRGQIYTCPSYWTLPPYPTTCSGYGRADVMLHELSHFYDVTDHAYGFDAAKKLTPALAAHNADTYMFYARSLNC
ncbi:hypothetical protein BDZ94DRAFT_50991 [Collybia nuda]|uniref:Lysine-specific metallo-endopeptidase domain-containing protein n=1 Tax=Collybia nuda TaxID=64659 RepID=A0A9P5YE80_9AGAR|nr:hypothetical protein BDZ94DRAFT_50991 [Collybia nuda]